MANSDACLSQLWIWSLSDKHEVLWDCWNFWPCVAINPLGKLPCIVDGYFKLSERLVEIFTWNFYFWRFLVKYIPALDLSFRMHSWSLDLSFRMYSWSLDVCGMMVVDAGWVNSSNSQVTTRQSFLCLCCSFIVRFRSGGIWQILCECRHALQGHCEAPLVSITVHKFSNFNWKQTSTWMAFSNLRFIFTSQF